MKKLAAIMCVCVLALVSWVQAGEDNLRPAVPSAASAISNPEMRKAVTDHSPNYDDLGRGSQVFTYVHVYKSMNDGLMPAIAPEDLDLIYRNDPVDQLMTSDAVRHYDSTPSVMMESAQSVSGEWTDNYERYINERDLVNFNLDSNTANRNQ